MNVMGISNLEPYNQYFHDTNIGLRLDGGELFAACEERYSRLKHHAGFPAGCLREIRRRYGLTLSAFQVVAVAENRPGHLAYLGGLPRTEVPIAALPAPLPRGVDLFRCDHQLAHASVAFRTSPFREALVITLDGLGFDLGRPCFGAVFSGSDNTLTRRQTCWSDGNSLGFFYTFVTQALGWSIADGEGKTMALAALGDPEVALEDLTPYVPHCRDGELVGGHRWTPRPFIMNHRQFIWDPAQNDLAALARRVGRENFAAAAQAHLERTVIAWVGDLLQRHPETRQLCLGGGIFLNVVLNSRLRETFPHLDIFVPPNPSDAGNGLGAALEAAAQAGAPRTQADRLQWLGSDYAPGDMPASVDFVSPVSEDLPDTIAALLERGNVVGLYQGRSEWGPRALGNRSVLAHPGLPGLRDRINRQMKQREPFMPFAPAIMAERLADWFQRADAHSPYMMFSYPVKSDRRDSIANVLHSDGTGRAQTVDERDNPLFYAIIRAFEARTGVPMILNTSYNLHGLPMVETPEDALDHLAWGCVDYLVMGERIVRRR